MDSVLAALVPETRPYNNRRRLQRRHRRAYFRLEYHNRYPDPAKYF